MRDNSEYGNDVGKVHDKEAALQQSIHLRVIRASMSWSDEQFATGIVSLGGLRAGGAENTLMLTRVASAVEKKKSEDRIKLLLTMMKLQELMDRLNTIIERLAEIDNELDEIDISRNEFEYIKNYMEQHNGALSVNEDGEVVGTDGKPLSDLTQTIITEARKKNRLNGQDNNGNFALELFAQEYLDNKESGLQNERTILSAEAQDISDKIQTLQANMTASVGEVRTMVANKNETNAEDQKSKYSDLFDSYKENRREIRNLMKEMGESLPVDEQVEIAQKYIAALEAEGKEPLTIAKLIEKRIERNVSEEALEMLNSIDKIQRYHKITEEAHENGVTIQEGDLTNPNVAKINNTF